MKETKIHLKPILLMAMSGIIGMVGVAQASAQQAVPVIVKAVARK